MTTAETLFEAEITGLNTDGETVTTAVLVEPNPAWTPESDDSEYRFHVLTLVDDEEEAREGFDDPGQANAYAAEVIRDARLAIEDAEAGLRDDHADALAGLAAEWHDGPDRELAERVADMISDGDAAKAIAALKAAGLI